MSVVCGEVLVYFVSVADEVEWKLTWTVLVSTYRAEVTLTRNITIAIIRMTTTNQRFITSPQSTGLAPAVGVEIDIRLIRTIPLCREGGDCNAGGGSF